MTIHHPVTRWCVICGGNADHDSIGHAPYQTASYPAPRHSTTTPREDRRRRSTAARNRQLLAQLLAYAILGSLLALGLWLGSILFIAVCDAITSR